MDVLTVAKGLGSVAHHGAAIRCIDEMPVRIHPQFISTKKEIATKPISAVTYQE
jgi:hypothetical protein